MTAGTTSLEGTPSQSGLGPITPGVWKRPCPTPVSRLRPRAIPPRGPAVQRGKERGSLVAPGAEQRLSTAARERPPRAGRRRSRAAVGWDRAGRGQKVKKSKAESAVEGEGRGSQGDGHDGKQGDLQWHFSFSFPSFSTLPSVSYATLIEATCGHIQERIARQGT